MGRYRVRVATGAWLYSGSHNRVGLWLVGTRGEAALELQLRPARGEEEEFDFDVPEDLGTLQFVKLRKQHSLVDDAWFCDRITVQGPGACTKVAFPCYRWVQGEGILTVPEGTARLAEDNALDAFQKHREKELKERQQTYCWATWKEGLPQTIAADSKDDLPPNMRFHEEKRLDFEWTLKAGALEMVLKRVYTLLRSWDHLEDFDQIFWGQKSTLAEMVHQSWQSDELFGYQFLNGANPMLLRRSTSLPSRLVLPSGTEELEAQLEKELQNGSLFEADFILLDGIPANVIRGEKQYLAAPLVMLKMDCKGKLLPMVIQIQPPDSRSPPPTLFLPSDPPLAWLLAKIWVRNSDFQLQELQFHLLNTHLVAEVIAVATMRCLSELHPIFKLLVPHIRYTLEINTRSRTQLISDGGIFDQVVSTGGGGHVQLLRRAMTQLTYRSLCPPDDLADRGLLGIPSALYAQDALRLWKAIARYVEGIVHIFYQSDDVVKGDPELQAWCREITEVGLCQAQDRGFPIFFQSQAQLCHFLTMCIFTCTAQHAAINQGQLDWYAWVPNAPCTMRMPPPTNKEDVTMAMVMGSLPDVQKSCLQMTISWHLGRRQPDMVRRGPVSIITEQRPRPRHARQTSQAAGLGSQVLYPRFPKPPQGLTAAPARPAPAGSQLVPGACDGPRDAAGPSIPTGGSRRIRSARGPSLGPTRGPGRRREGLQAELLGFPRRRPRRRPRTSARSRATSPSAPGGVVPAPALLGGAGPRPSSLGPADPGCLRPPVRSLLSPAARTPRSWPRCCAAGPSWLPAASSSVPGA